MDIGSLEFVPVVETAGVVPSITTPANHHGVMQVGGVDTVHFNVWFSIGLESHTALIERLDEAQRKARDKNASVFITLNASRGSRFLEVQPRGSNEGVGYKYVFVCDGIRFLMSSKPEGKRAPNMIAQAYGGTMLRHGWSAESVWKEIRYVVDAMNARIVDHSLGRLDAFVDVVGLDVTKLVNLVLQRKFVTRARDIATYSAGHEESIRESITKAFDRGCEAVIEAVKSAYAHGRSKTIADAVAACRKGEFDIATYGGTKEKSGMQLGKGTTILRCYDKQLQLARMHPERIPEMHDAWGVDGAVKVTRVEYQMRGQALRSHGVTTIHDWEHCKTAVVEYLTHQWALAFSKYDRIHTDRREVHHVWRRVQAVFRSVFAGGTRPREKRVVVPDQTAGRRFVKTAVSYLRAAASRLVGGMQATEDVRDVYQQLIDESVGEKGGWDREHADSMQDVFRLWDRLGQETRPLASVVPERLLREKLLEECFS